MNRRNFQWNKTICIIKHVWLTFSFWKKGSLSSSFNFRSLKTQYKSRIFPNKTLMDWKHNFYQYTFYVTWSKCSSARSFRPCTKTLFKKKQDLKWFLGFAQDQKCSIFLLSMFYFVGMSTTATRFICSNWSNFTQGKTFPRTALFVLQSTMRDLAFSRPWSVFLSVWPKKCLTWISLVLSA